MAGLELQLSTAKAQTELKNVEGALSRLSTAFQNFKPGSGLSSLATDLAKIKPFDASVITGLNALTKAVNSISRNTNIEAIATGLRALSNVNLSGVTSSVTGLASALRGIQVPRNLAALGNNLAKIGNEAQMAVSGVSSLSAAMGGLRANSGKLTYKDCNILRCLGDAANYAKEDVTRLSTAMSTMQGVLGALGVQASLRGIIDFGRESLDASTKVQQFVMAYEAVGGKGTGEKALQDLTALVTKLGLPLEVSITNFQRLSLSMLQSGKTGEQALKVFEGFGTAFSVFGLSADQVNRAFNAINQSFTKGQVYSEELKQQLGEVFPAFGLLAQSMNVTTSELAELLKEGKVGSDVFLKLADDLKSKFGDSLKGALSQGRFAIVAFNNALFKLQAVVGGLIFDRLKESIFALAKTMENPAFLGFAATLASIANAVGVTFFAAVNLVINSIQTFTSAFGVALQVLVNVGTTINSYTGVFTLLGQVIGVVGMALGIAVQVLGPFAIAIGLAAAATWTFHKGMSAVKLAVDLATKSAFVAALGYAALGAVVIGIVATAYVLYQAWSQGITVQEAYNQTAASLSGILNSVKTSLLGTATAGQGAAGGISEAGSAAAIAEGAFYKTSSIIGDFTTGVDGVAKPASTAAKATNELGEAVNIAGTPMSKIGKAATDASDGLSQMGPYASEAATGLGKIGNTAPAAATGVNSVNAALRGGAAAGNAAAAAYDRAAAAARRLASAQQQAGGGGGGRTVQSQAGGGLSSSPTRFTVAPMDAFNNAPKLAGGIDNTNSLQPSLPGNGIPAVLHPNEAVVPLAGGGSIPVESTGGTAGAAQRSGDRSGHKILLDLYTVALESKTELNRIWESIDKMAVLMVDGHDKINNTLLRILNATFEIDKTLSTRSLSGGGSGGSGGGGGGGGSGDYESFYQQVLQASRQRSDALREQQQFMSTNGVSYGSGPTMYTTQQQHQIDDYRDQINDASFDIQRLMQLNPEFAKRYQDEYVAKRRALGLSDRPGYATGSPNAWKDAKGGFNAILHPDEAVIPLPDGRRVPVALPDSMTRQMENMDRQMKRRDEDSRDARNNRSDAPEKVAQPIMINMTVNTPDANSFRRSKDQITNDLRAQLERASNRLGPTRTTREDPTKRMGK